EGAGEPASSEGPLPEPGPGFQGRWQEQFVIEMAERIAGMTVDGAARSPLAFVLADLRALLRKDPRKFTLLLLAGYLHVGNALSRRHGEAGDGAYARAAEALHHFAGDALPEGTLELLQPAPGEDTQAAAPPEE